MTSKSTSDDSLESFIPFSTPVSEDELIEVAKNELGETDELKEECLLQLRRLMKEHKVTCINTDDFLLRFLRVKKFDVQRSFESLQNYVRKRAELHDRLLRLEPKTMETVLRLTMMGFLPYRDKQRRLIFLLRSGIWNPDICSDEEFATILCLLINYAAETQSSQTVGVITLLDLKTLPLKYMVYTLRHASFVQSFVFDSLPVRYPTIHCILDSTISKIVYRLLSPFIPKKMKDRILFHWKTTEDLREHIPHEILPGDFGGNLGPLTGDHLAEIMQDYLKYMKDEQHYFLQKNC